MLARLFKWLQVAIAIAFIIITLGFVSVELEWTDGSRFRYRGWTINKSTMQNIIIFVLILVIIVLAALLRCN